MRKINLVLRKLLLKNSFYYIIFSLAIIYALISLNIDKKSVYNINDTHFEGILTSYTIEGNKFSFILKGKEKLKCNYYFETEEELKYYTKNLKLGAILKVVGTIEKPINNTISNNFNYKKYLYYKEIFYICKVDSFKMDTSNISILYKVKNYVVSRILSMDNISDYLMTFIIGDKSLLDNETFNNYRENGVTHLFAISGMHIGLFSTCIIWILKKLKISENKSYIITVIFIWFYAFLTNFTSSVLRAGMLFSLLAINKIFYTEVKSINVLLLSGSILIFSNPNIFMDIGFIYSFLTTFGLMYSSKTLKKHRILGTSVVALLFSLPVTINNFYEFNILSVLINIIFVPLVSVIIYPLCLITFFLKFLEPITHFSLCVLELLNDICASIDLFHITTAKMNFFVLIMYYLILLSLVNKKLKLFLMLTGCIIILNNHKSIFNNNYYIDFLDIGQGDSILIRSPHHKEVIMIDTGGSLNFKVDEWKKRKEYKVSDNILTYLKSLGITRIDYILLTHGDYDHMGEAINLVNNFKVEKVIFNCGEFNELEQELIEVLDKKKIPYYSCIKELNIDDNKLYFLNNKDYGNENDNSSVIYTELNNHKFLFMGDAGVEVEQDLLNKYNLKDIDVLKVGHHGSKTSSSKNFIDEVNPKYSIISVGNNNRYGHPNDNVLEILENSKIYRTDQDGSIMFKINNDKLKTEICAP